MRRFTGGLVAVVALAGGAMALTVGSPLGRELWHHNAGFLVALVAAVAAWPLWRTRRFASMAMAVSGSFATVTGFVMLYTKDFPFKEWLTWWHAWTSVLFLLAFLAHWMHNNPRLLSFTRRLAERDRAVGVTLALAWCAVGGLLLWSALPVGREAFTRESYLFLASWTVLVGVALPYGVWLAFRAPRLQRALARPDVRNRARAAVDTGLFVANWGAMLTGFALVYFAEPLRAGDLKYPSKWWHTATSVLLVSLLALHVGFNARLLAAHARRYERELGGAPAEPRGAPAARDP